jgi:predicted PurR-regulated permease PerM
MPVNIKHIFVNHGQMIVLTVTMIVIAFIIYFLRSVILPLFVGFVLAFVLVPIIQRIEALLPGKSKWKIAKRVSIIAVIYIIILLLISLIIYISLVSLGKSLANLVQTAPTIFSDALSRLQNLLSSLRDHLPPGSQQQFDTALQNLGNVLGQAFQRLFTASISVVPSTIGFILGFAILPVFLFYLLKDWEKLGRSILSWLSPDFAIHVKNVFFIVEDVFGRYVSSVLTLGLSVGTLALVGLLIIRAPFAPILAIIVGTTEIIPAIGPWLGGGIGVLLTLAMAPDKAIWVVVVFLVVQLIENQLLVPRIHGAFLNIHPAVSIFLLIIGAYLAGIWGLALAVPLAALVVRIYKYVYRSTRNEDIRKQIET